jgi:hypothetical protein
MMYRGRKMDRFHEKPWDDATHEIYGVIANVSRYRTLRSLSLSLSTDAERGG